jgi:hypothetical protein
MQEMVEMSRVTRRLLYLSMVALLLASCKISSEIDNRNGTSITTPPETPTEFDPTYHATSTKASQETLTPAITGVHIQLGCEQEGHENPTESPNDFSYLLYCSIDEGMEKCSVWDVLQNETYPLPNGLIPLGWSPTGDRLLLVDESGPGVYTADTLGGDPVEVFSVGSDQVETDWGWWLSEDEIIVAGRVRSEGGLLYWQYYRVNVESGSSDAFDRDETWQIYDVATNGGLWIEGWPEIELVDANHRRIPLWDEGDVAVEITPYYSYISTYPNNCGVVFIGCLGDRAQGDRSCSIYNAVFDSEGISSVAPLYALGDAANADSIEVSPDSRKMAFIDYWRNLIVIDLSDGQIVYERAFPFTIRATPQLVWSPDSNEIAMDIDTAEEGHIVIILDLQLDTMDIIGPTPVTRLVEWRAISQ